MGNWRTESPPHYVIVETLVHISEQGNLCLVVVFINIIATILRQNVSGVALTATKI